MLQSIHVLPADMDGQALIYVGFVRSWLNNLCLVLSRVQSMDGSLVEL